MKKNYLLFLTVLFSILCYAQNKKEKGEIYLPLKSRNEIKLIPLPDTLYPGLQYEVKMRKAPRYTFSELFFDKGIAMRTDSILTLKPRNKKKDDIDTATLRIIGFTNSSRILLVHNFIIMPDVRIYPTLNKKRGAIVLNNNELERNQHYKKDLFSRHSVINYFENDVERDDFIITNIALSLVNKEMNKNLFAKNDNLSDEMLHEIRKLKSSTYCYIRLDLKKDKKSKSIWTRISIDP